MRYATVFTLAALTILFWGFVFWAADAFGTWGLVTVVGGALLLLVGWLGWEARHSMEDPAEAEELYVPSDWDWYGESSVRRPGLGR